MWAVEEARQRNGQIRLVTAWRKPPLAWYAAVLETAAGEIVAEDSPQEAAEKLQADALKTTETAGVAATGQVVHSESPAGAILDAAKDADLVVVGFRGHGGFTGLHLGSVATQVITHAPCPVLVVRPKAA
ncbi:universal stress protein [Arthrobacter sp. NicSoilB4]|uniref:universal stress protein n=1 Tax=Arthrobacter sp. NicSoilB4 TaxID=2830997 RepID=UPI0031FE683F